MDKQVAYAIAGATAAAVAYRVLTPAPKTASKPAAKRVIKIDRMKLPKRKEVWLLFGKNGWIGGMMTQMLKEQGKEFYLADSRTENRESVRAELEKYKPTHVLNAAGVTGVPNGGWQLRRASWAHTCC